MTDPVAIVQAQVGLGPPGRNPTTPQTSTMSSDYGPFWA